MNVVFGFVKRTARESAGLMLAFTAIAGIANAAPGPPPVPEIDPSSIASALTLLIGGAFMLTGRSRKS